MDDSWFISIFSIFLKFYYINDLYASSIFVVIFCLFVLLHDYYYHYLNSSILAKII